jgi:hypothetical protein
MNYKNRTMKAITELMIMRITAILTPFQSIGGIIYALEWYSMGKKLNGSMGRIKQWDKEPRCICHQ